MNDTIQRLENGASWQAGAYNNGFKKTGERQLKDPSETSSNQNLKKKYA